jgi:hypothetical protein
VEGHVYATLGTLRLRLASWRSSNERFQDRLIPVDPELRFVPNRSDGLVAAQASTYWLVDRWDAGEGEDRWDPENPGFEKSTNVTAKRIGKGIVLGALQIATVDNGGSSIFNDGRRFGYGQGSIWTVEDGSGYKWDVTNSKWGAGITTGAGTSDVTSLTDGDDTFMYSGHEDLSIWRWKSGTSEEHFASFTKAPIVRSWGGLLYALDGDDLYLVDKLVADTRTLVADVIGDSDEYLAATPWSYGRMSVSDKGPIWFQRLDNGQTFIFEYSQAEDVAVRIGKLPVDFAFPYSIYFSSGFIFVAFRLGPTHASAGDAFIYFQRGAQRGTLGPVRAPSGATASKPILIAGTDGDDLIFYFDGAMWAYNFTAGGIFQLSSQVTTGTPQDAITLGPSSFITPVTSGGNTLAVERFNREAFTTQTANLDSGLHDLSYFDIPKMLIEIIVITDPLPANTSVQVAYSIDGASFVTASGTHDTDGATSKTFVISAAGAAVRARRFAIRLILSTSNTANTPTVRGWTARAYGAAHERQIVMEVDVSKDGEQSTTDLLSGLDALVATQQVVTFSLPFKKASGAIPESIPVVVRNVISPDALIPDSRVSATVELRARDLVVV